MKKILLSLLFLVLGGSLLAQPQYYNYNSGGISNSIPFGSYTVSGYKSQYLMLANEYILPSPAPAGNITKFYIRMSTTGTGTYSHFTMKMGQSSITVFPPGVAYTGQLDTVYNRASGTFSSTANTWMMIELDRPYSYNPAQSLIIEIYSCGHTGGMNVWQTAGTTGIYRRNNISGTPSCVFTYAGQDGRILQCGVDVAPPSAANYGIVLPTPGVNTNYVIIPYNSGMVGFGNNITIEGWMKIGGITTPNTVLNKGASSFDYQLGVNSSTANPFFRAMGTVVIGNSINIPVNVWTHLAVTSNGSTVIFYVNGVAAQTIPTACTLGSSTNVMRIGRGGNDPGSGKLDEVRLWSVTRTPTEIFDNMCIKWIPNSTTGLKGKWHLDSTFVDSVSGWNGSAMGNVGFDTAMNCVVTNISNNQNEVPGEFKLYQNYPNPFNPTTTIKFSIPKDAYVEMKLYDIIGREVATLISDPYRAGVYLLDFNASRLTSGIYFYQIIAGDFKDTKKMVLLK